jgi:hypothetical protein
MPKKGHTEEQIIAALKQHDGCGSWPPLMCAMDIGA